MVLSNGIDEPIIINNPDQYLKTLEKYLNIGNADYLVPKTFDATVKKKEQSEMMTRTYSYDKNNELTSIGKLSCAL